MKILLITLLLLSSSFANAQVFKCLSDDGAISYSDIKCGSVPVKPNASAKHSENPLLPLALNVNSAIVSVREQAKRYFYQAIFFAYLLMSRICYCAYRKDKKHARTQQWRTPESTLHIYELFGGWPGGLIAQRKLRHKNKKLSYQINFWLIVTLHIVGWYDYFMLNQSLLHSVIVFVSASA